MSAACRLLVLGTRTFAVEVADMASDIPGVVVEGFVENLDRDRAGQTLEGLPIHWVGDIGALAATHEAVCALSTTFRSRFTCEVEALGLRFATLVHPTARVSRSAVVGEGSVVNAGAIIAARAVLGRHVIVNRGALIGHHTRLGDHATVGPGANIGGCCEVGEATYIGIGAVILDQLRIGAHAIVGAASLVTREVADRVQVMGVPARVTKENIDGR